VPGTQLRSRWAIASLAEIESIHSVDAEKLAAHGITSTGGLLRAGATAESRRDLAASTGISGDLILRWVVEAALFHIIRPAKEESVGA
jgi:Domain of unknown function (DUF4332)